MRILGLDLGNNTGWALYDDGLVFSGTWINFRNTQSRFEGGGMRYLRLIDQIQSLHSTKPIDRIAFEEVRSHKRPKQRKENIGAAHVYGGYLAHLSAWAEKNLVPYGAYPVGVIKTRATGRGNAGKALITKAAAPLSPTPVTDDNQADALWIMVLECERANIHIFDTHGHADSVTSRVRTAISKIVP